MRPGEGEEEGEKQLAEGREEGRAVRGDEGDSMLEEEREPQPGERRGGDAWWGW